VVTVVLPHPAPPVRGGECRRDHRRHQALEFLQEGLELGRDTVERAERDQETSRLF
jgi:hypothetical protein